MAMKTGILFSFLRMFAPLLLCASAATAEDLQWAGDTKNTAANGFLAPSQDLVIVVDSRPRVAAKTA